MKPILTIGLPAGTTEDQFNKIKKSHGFDENIKEDYHVLLYTQTSGDNWKFEIIR